MRRPVAYVLYRKVNNLYNRGMARPRSFDEAQVVQAALDRFWDTGYAATSLDDLGQGKGSLYGAFDD